MKLTESDVEDAALEWFAALGYEIGHGPHLAPGEPAAARDSFGDVVLVQRLREAVSRLNPTIPADARDEAVRKVLRVATPSLTQTNREFHRLLRNGVPVEYPRPDGSLGPYVAVVSAPRLHLIPGDDASGAPVGRDIQSYQFPQATSPFTYCKALRTASAGDVTCPRGLDSWDR